MESMIVGEQIVLVDQAAWEANDGLLLNKINAANRTRVILRNTFDSACRVDERRTFRFGLYLFTMSGLFGGSMRVLGIDLLEFDDRELDLHLFTPVGLDHVPSRPCFPPSKHLPMINQMDKIKGQPEKLEIAHGKHDEG